MVILAPAAWRPCSAGRKKSVSSSGCAMTSSTVCAALTGTGHSAALSSLCKKAITAFFGLFGGEGQVIEM